MLAESYNPAGVKKSSATAGHHDGVHHQWNPRRSTGERTSDSLDDRAVAQHPGLNRGDGSVRQHGLKLLGNQSSVHWLCAANAVAALHCESGHHSAAEESVQCEGSQIRLKSSSAAGVTSSNRENRRTGISHCHRRILTLGASHGEANGMLAPKRRPWLTAPPSLEPRLSGYIVNMKHTFHLPYLALGALLSAGVACAPPERAPSDIDDILLFSYRHYGSEDPNSGRSLADAALALEHWYDDREDPQEPIEAQVARLGPEELAVLDPQPGVADGPAAVGVLFARDVACTPAQIAELYLNDDQMSLFPTSFASYARSGRENMECYLQETCPEAQWLASVVKEQQVFLTPVTYTFTMTSGMRSFDAQPPDAQPGDPTVRGRVVRVWMNDEAIVDPDTIGRFRQSYQFEFLVPRNGGTLHFYSMWTHLESSSLNTEASIFLNSYIDGISDYMTELEAHCATM